LGERQTEGPAFDPQLAHFLWGCRSIGRSPALHAGGSGIEARHLHFLNLLPD
tara:strand:- start:1963 stop:2118 length:156 start_codon:yes stop_codon:yes gene_type:complete